MAASGNLKLLKSLKFSPRLPLIVTATPRTAASTSTDSFSEKGSDCQRGGSTTRGTRHAKKQSDRRVIGSENQELICTLYSAYCSLHDENDLFNELTY